MNKKFNYGYVMVALAFLIAFIGNYMQYQMTPLSATIIKQYGLTSAQFSSLFTSPMIPGILFSLISGILCDKFGVRICLAATSVIGAVALICRVFITSYSGLMAIMIIAGIGVTFLNSNMAKILGGWFKPEDTGKMLGYILVGSSVATGIATGTTALFPSVKAAYTFAAVLYVVIAALWIIFAKNGNPEILEAQKKAEKTSVLADLKIVMGNVNVWKVGICNMFLMGALVTISSFLPLALQNEKGMSVASSGLITSIILFSGVLGMILGPIVADKIGNFKILVFVAETIAAVGCAFAWLLPVGPLMYVAMCITGCCINAALPVITSIPIQLDGIGPKYAGTAGGVVATIQLLGCVVIPTYVIANIAGSNYSLILMLGGVSALISALAVFTLPRLKRN
ncbi:MFS transporter, NNP family, nitrate/nitrite transporter [Acetitomaculum ruminis DSM 5522]|uniref:Lysosomal dipeptide transporter MFSD1 n=1 Tax=Acetitomaculum ruminis DSM 5522 TaxID=1120918 RepID=A0A1I0V1V2_9FIRM|nr:MFS transporter [Acetitomaculum ruminis]SFA70113.1 MFS transporter, NNP family, nitrate/nitrite transporter [Acetitomaculum ruminis DSM 5522]